MVGRRGEVFGEEEQNGGTKGKADEKKGWRGQKQEEKARAEGLRSRERKHREKAQTRRWGDWPSTGQANGQRGALGNQGNCGNGSIKVE